MSAEPQQRCIALGASNLARLALPLLDALRAATGGPVALHAALGRGRSFVVPSRLLGRGLAPIHASRLWREIEAAHARGGLGLVMDVGNDILYHVEVPRIVEHVDRTLARLHPHVEQLVVVGLPLASLRTLTPLRFRLVRSLLVPGCRLSFAAALAAAERLHAELARLAQQHRAVFHELPQRWYGFDPIHVRRRHWREAVHTFVGAGGRTAPTPSADGALARLRFLSAAPDERTWFGRPQRRTQPAVLHEDGSTVSLW